MPVAGQVYKQKIKLPNYPEEAWVEVISNPKADLWDDLPDNKKAAADVVLSRFIVDWNFTDKDGKKTEINPENVAICLSAFDRTAIMNTLTPDQNILSLAKKNN